LNKHNRFIKTNDHDDRRSKHDRRSFTKERDFPLKTKTGAVVMRDRRTLPDRRLSNISVEISDLNDEDFAEFFDQD
jgi:hypothetical protein